jgi:hypothetical protein
MERLLLLVAGRKNVEVEGRRTRDAQAFANF